MSRPATAATRLAGVVGNPVRHSLSPLIHNAWIAAAELDAVYVALQSAPASFGDLVKGLAGGAAVGINVTIPFKESAAALADERSPAAQRAAAANVLVFREGRILADNTDGVAAVINATSLGMTGEPPLELTLDGAPTTAVVMDMVYQPLKTDLLTEAERRGHPVADGLEMLIGQARPSFEAFFGRPPPEVDVRRLCQQALDQGS